MKFYLEIPVVNGYYWFITPFSEPSICEIRGNSIYVPGLEGDCRKSVISERWKFSTRLTPPTPR